MPLASHPLIGIHLYNKVAQQDVVGLVFCVPVVLIANKDIPLALDKLLHWDDQGTLVVDKPEVLAVGTLKVWIEDTYEVLAAAKQNVHLGWCQAHSRHVPTQEMEVETCDQGPLEVKVPLLKQSLQRYPANCYDSQAREWDLQNERAHEPHFPEKVKLPELKLHHPHGARCHPKHANSHYDEVRHVGQRDQVRGDFHDVEIQQQLHRHYLLQVVVLDGFVVFSDA
ncbi:uncharacterized protein PGTG_16634 [Puccinia graminis f. sp. tritici CRL 75-36-700-3]|uniref:Uncharacterized protein n=1 Tax=Puccinia graminis f. sp. tritici (strain CRL 75-36-700-3 / race SCCL) TaxID=418459 RepID=E3L233_PUCGT|nr:uncharacterized protein PGTG_16634 [Puccinia graminis f. sp. tritici CRL 75-36-700-3]EFP90608.1 hypothetical protein PGTG_16634 [Puccinia graminis f. sp. tritici CRL 75-36-700-3]